MQQNNANITASYKSNLFTTSRRGNFPPYSFPYFPFYFASRYFTLLLLFSLLAISSLLPSIAGANPAVVAVVSVSGSKEVGSRAGDVANIEQVKEVEAVQDFVNNLHQDIFTLINDDVKTKTAKLAELSEIFTEYVDVKWMSLYAIGKYRRMVAKAKLQAYSQSYQKYMIHNYVPKFEKYGAVDYKILNVNQKKPNLFEISMKYSDAGQPDILVSYMLLKKKGSDKYQLIDIKTEGVSLLTTQRSDFSGLIAKKGFDYFLNKLQEKLAQQTDQAEQEG